MNTFVNLMIILLLNILGSCLKNLNTVFLSQNAIKPVYITTFIDSVVFFYAFKLTTASSGFAFILVFALGKLVGVFLGNKIENKLAYGLLEVDVYKHTEQGKVLADALRNKGYSVTTTVGYGVEGLERLMLKIILPRNCFSDLHEILKNDGNVNMSIKTISKIYGKVGIVN
ncbi:MAG: hypothetical protein WBH44_11235 [Proteocatella sp.]